MRFHLGAIPDEFQPDATWRPIREPGPIALQFIAVPVGFGAAALASYCWHLIGSPNPVQFHLLHPILFVVLFLLFFVVLVVLHELLHAVVHPRLGRTRATVIGAWPSRLLFYAHYSGPLTRNRFLAVFAMPFLVITVLPLVIAATTGLPLALHRVASWFSIWNALFACGDYVGMALIFFQIPRAATVQNQGWRTYWKLPERTAT